MGLHRDLPRILVVDDVQAIRLLLTELLRREGCHVEVAADGRQAVETARRMRPHLVLLDIQMPGPSLGETLDALGNLKPAPRVVLLTAMEGPSEDPWGPNRVVGVLKKPFDIEQVRRWARRVRAEAGSGGETPGSPGIS